MADLAHDSRIKNNPHGLKLNIGTCGSFSQSQKLDCRRCPFVIGVAGGTSSGKSSVCAKIIERIRSDSETSGKNIVCLSQENFYRDLRPEEAELAQLGNYNFDHPDAFDIGLLVSTLRDIKQRKKVRLPKYDYRSNSRISGEFLEITSADVVLFEGILTFYWPELREIYDMKLFVDTDADTRLARRVTRDINERGRSLDTVLNQYINSVKPAFEEFCLPTKKFADVIIPRGADNNVAIDLIVQSLKDILANSSSLRPKATEEGQGDSRPLLVKRSSDSKSARLH